MKKLALAGLIALAATVAMVPPGEAAGRGGHGHGGHHHFHRGHSRVIVGFGPSFYWGPRPYWGYYYPAPYAVYAPPPVVVQESPPVYIQQQTPPPPPPAAAREQYWYYCESAKGYYPTVPSCPEAWVLVPPRP